MDVDSHAAGSEQQPPPAGGAGAGSTRGRRVAERLHGVQQTLQAAYRRLAEASEGSIAAEWLLDNYYIVERAVRLVRDEFPSEFERRLPQVPSGDLQGYPLVYAVAREVVAAGQSHLDLDTLIHLISEFQVPRSLSIAEVWALPILLRLALLESLARTVAPLGLSAQVAAQPDAARMRGDELSPPSPDQIVASCIRSLRTLDTADWKAFFEQINATERVLRTDPAGVYARMEFDTRDRYRKVVEELAAGSEDSEEAVAAAAVRLARESPAERRTHVGYYLVDDGFDVLARTVGYHPDRKARRHQLLTRYPTLAYLGGIAAVTLAYEAALWVALPALGAGLVLTAVAAALALVPATTIGVALINALITRILRPRVLPKMDFDKGIPTDCQTLVVIPAILTDADDAAALVSKLEIRRLANADPHLHFALLTDFADAPRQTMPEDDELLQRVSAGVQSLNAKYGGPQGDPFHLLHRRRQWNPAEGCWMGWERKRGKLTELNRLLAGDQRTSYVRHVGDPDVLRSIRFVITLDADTELPRDSAQRLVATLAHPLNRAVFDVATGRVTAGYTILQPRIEGTSISADVSRFSALVAGDSGLDPYTRAVSDLYQDLFGEGIYFGKGIYDPEAFERSLRGRVPDNAILSHDLFEGIHGRTGFVADIVLFDEFSADYLTYSRRLHRWARGDWQLLPWLRRRVPLEDGRTGASRFSLISRWKILDNLRGSLFEPSLLAFLFLAWGWLPGFMSLWTLLALLVPAAPVFSGELLAALGRTSPTFRTRRSAVGRWVLQIVFLPHRAAVLCDALLRTLYRLAVSRKHLLEWTTAASSARRLAGRAASRVTWSEMAVPPVTALGAAGVLAAYRLGALAPALPLLMVWFLSPEIARFMSRPRRRRVERLTQQDTRRFRLLARRTWLFFETFVGPDDQWLPPDHFQEDPRGETARRTSPTNIGLLLLATVSAYDLGYAGVLSVALRLKETLDTLRRMERYRGHLYNWYDTANLQPLAPRYVSAVDSGNLAGCLLAVKHSGVELTTSPIIGAARWEGMLDTLGVLDEVIAAASHRYGSSRFAALRGCVDNVRGQVAVLKDHPEDWARGVTRLVEEGCPEFDRALAAVIAPQVEELDARLLGELRAWYSRTHQHLEGMLRDLQLHLPWTLLMAHPPALLAGAEATGSFAATWAQLRACLVADAAPLQVRDIDAAARASVSQLDEQLAARPGADSAVAEARAWLENLAKALVRARDAADALVQTLLEVSQWADTLFRDMDFTFLYDEQRHVFYIGYNATANALDDHHYDLLASEARLASFVAIAKGDVPEEHWLYLGRPLGRVGGANVLLSWSGTMFEYLMPPLLLHEGADSLMGRTGWAVVREQIAYARRRGVPWGISESGFYQFDAHQNYQYRAFGIPDLGFKRGLEDDLVIAPYACALAARVAPHAVLDNLDRLQQLGVIGRYGLYEAIDCTPSRQRPDRAPAIVRSFMAHHQGMILVALDNLLNGDPMVRRFHSEPVAQTAEALLFERPVTRAPIERTRPEPARRRAPVRPHPAMPPWPVPLDAEFPQVQVLSNGRYRVVVTEGGGGGSQWNTLALTRWCADTTRDSTGFRVYLRDVDSGDFWSPVSTPSTDGQVLFHPHMVEHMSRAHDITVRQRVWVAPGDDVEIRHLTLRNEGRARRHVEVTSYAEVVLGDASEDRRHPAFSKLFVESEYLDDLHALAFRRRPRGERERACCLVHMMVPRDGHTRSGGYETARDRFLGRADAPFAPQGFADGARGTRGIGTATLDPIMALSSTVELPPLRSISLAYVLVAADTRQAAVAVARSYRSLEHLEWTLELARRHTESELADLRLAAPDLPVAQRLLSLLLYPHHTLRVPPSMLARNQLGQSSLWQYAVSGDLPMLLVRIREAEASPLLQTLLRMHRHWRQRGVRIDLVILNEQPSGYGAEADSRIARAIAQTGADGWMHQPGGVFVIHADQITEADQVLLATAARAVLDESAGSLAEQVARVPEGPARLPPLVPTLADSIPAELLERPGGLLFDNGMGGFSANGREYVIHLAPGQSTPAPWVNVIANPRCGCVVSESGGGYSWADNSGENRLTPWRNDPVADEPGEALYLRDEETAAVWSPTPRPAPGPGSYQIRHGAGYTTFDHRSHGLDQHLRVFVPREDPVKIVQLRLTNRLTRPRRITATYYVEWVLGSARDGSEMFVIPEFDPDRQCILARNPWKDDFADRVAFVSASHDLHGLTGDRSEFLGRRGSYSSPAGLRAIGLASAVRPGLDPCAAVQLHVDLGPGASTDIHFVLGQGVGRDEALGLARTYRDRARVQAAWTDVGQQWDEILGAVSVRTPDPALDVMLNRWLLYQTLASRIWGRAGYYQSGGAFGFRDQLQDVLAVLHTRPAICRAHVLEAARRQFEDGDVLHWWHPPSGIGVRTRCSDDLLWLPFVTAHYVATTGDAAILSEAVPFLSGEPLRPDEAERYARFTPTAHRATLYEHCVAAIERGITAGPHGLPLFGAGDWNDGMNRVGIQGRGESVWLGWFVYATLMRFAPISERRGDGERAKRFRSQAETLRQALEATAWDGAWYRRGYYDDGRPLGSAHSAECRIDSLSQSWAVLSGAGDPQRAAVAMNAVRQSLIREADGLVLLLAPPFAGTEADPGYIRAYPPGVRENGGQYTHAAIWVLWALAELGEGDLAGRLFQTLLPIHHALTADAAARYRVEPYVLAADVYGVPPHTGRGGWTWYTGAAGWAYRFGLEVILGIRPEPGGWRVDPCIPKTWPGFEVTLRDQSTTYRIRVEN
ncbi:MAG TPA: glucoamylase family protein, partial [Candidatus Dormibacteraeota bacterium]|nr:glucoamylase family protein [Candidatus Dormibacteraeota bacterium]